MNIGAETVRNAKDVEVAIAHAVVFIFSLAINEELIKSTQEYDTTLIPGLSK